MNATYSIKEWESGFFNRNIYSIELIDTNTRDFMKGVNGLVTSNVDSRDYDTLDELCHMGFSYVEGDIDFCKKIQLTEKFYAHNGLIAKKNDIDELSTIIKGLYIFSRFREPWFSEQERDRFYLKWLENAINGSFDDICILSRDVRGTIDGYISVKITGTLARIGLLGVRKNSERAGIASYLIAQAEAFAVMKNAETICVSTQVSNISAIRLYTKNNFISSSTSIWLYKNETYTI